MSCSVPDGLTVPRCLPRTVVPRITKSLMRESDLNGIAAVRLGIYPLPERAYYSAPLGDSMKPGPYNGQLLQACLMVPPSAQR